LRLAPLALISCLLLLASCKSAQNPPGKPLARTGDEIMVAGQLFHTGTRVVLWTDPGGYDAYRTDRRFAPYDQADYEKTRAAVKDIKSPNRYGLRYTPPATQPSTRPNLNGPNFQLSETELNRIRAGWAYDDLRNRVDQFVYHYDVAGTSQTCFKVLHDMRGLSVHFMLDLDGTIYHTLDLKERAWHATTSNTRSVGIEIANMGAYQTRANNAFSEWYTKDATGHTIIHIPARFGDGGMRDKSITLRPIRDEIITGTVQGKTYHQYDLTPQQYDSLIKLTATLCTVFPNMKCDYPKDDKGQLIDHKLPDQQLANYQGLLGHYHVQLDKQDPGPAFQWERVINGARALMRK
jgi:N-acetylmuramoyl-L-alanine amidase